MSVFYTLCYYPVVSLHLLLPMAGIFIQIGSHPRPIKSIQRIFIELIFVHKLSAFSYRQKLFYTQNQIVIFCDQRSVKQLNF